MVNKKANRLELKKIKILRCIMIDRSGFKTFYAATSTHYKIDSVVLKMGLSKLFTKKFTAAKNKANHETNCEKYV